MGKSVEYVFTNLKAELKLLIVAINATALILMKVIGNQQPFLLNSPISMIIILAV